MYQGTSFWNSVWFRPKASSLTLKFEGTEILVGAAPAVGLAFTTGVEVGFGVPGPGVTVAPTGGVEVATAVGVAEAFGSGVAVL